MPSFKDCPVDDRPVDNFNFYLVIMKHMVFDHQGVFIQYSLCVFFYAWSYTRLAKMALTVDPIGQTKIEKNIFRCPMGSPVSAIFANIVMEHVEEKALSSAPNLPKWWFRDTSDSHVCVQREYVDEFHSHLNSINPHHHIKFTIEIESEGSIAFLDFKTTRQENGSITVSVTGKTPTVTLILASSWRSVNLYLYFLFFIFPLNKHEYNIFNKISTVKKKWKGHKYSNLIICPLIKYIYFRIKRKLERKE